MSATAPTLPAGDTSATTFECPRCRRAHPWAPEHAGKTARCGCGHVLKVPAALAGVGPAEPVDRAATPPALPVDYASAPAPDFLRAPVAPADDDLPPEVEAELAATGAYGEEDLTLPDPRRDLHVPVALILLGFVITVIDVAYGAGAHAGVAIAGGVVLAGFKLVVGTVLTLGAALVAAKLAGINFGPVGPALLKLAALATAPSALGDLTTSLLGGDAAVAQLGWVVRVVLYWALVCYLFRLDGAQTAVVVGTISIVKLVMTVLVGSLIAVAVASAAPTVHDAPDADAADGQPFDTTE